jgi:hypothetical protein
MTDPEAPSSPLERFLRAGATVIAPATLLSALLFYFGYVSSRAQYQYFGIDVDTIGLSTQDYIMRSPQPLLVPLLVLTLIGISALALHVTTHRWITDHPNHGGPLQHWIRGAVGVGLCSLGTGVTLLFLYPAVHDWPLYNLITPLLICVGAALTGYGTRILELLRPQPSPMLQLRRTIRVLNWVIIAAGVFWTAATVAQWSGRGLAQQQATTLTDLPSVIMDTKERLFLRSPGIEETLLPDSPGQTFHYRYRHLRLLIHGHDRMFLVPDTWSASDSTLVVPLSDSVRIQFQFQNQHP